MIIKVVSLLYLCHLSCLGSFHKLRVHLGVGKWAEKLVDYYVKVQTRNAHGQKFSKNANVFCESSLKKYFEALKFEDFYWEYIYNYEFGFYYSPISANLEIIIHSRIIVPYVKYRRLCIIVIVE